VLLQLHYVDRMVNYTLILSPDLIKEDENCNYLGCNNMSKKAWTTMKLQAQSSSKYTGNKLPIKSVSYPTRLIFINILLKTLYHVDRMSNFTQNTGGVPQDGKCEFMLRGVTVHIKIKKAYSFSHYHMISVFI